MTNFDPSAPRSIDLDDLLHKSEQALRRLSEANSELQTITGAGEAGKGLVKAVVDNGGGLLGLTLDPRVMRQDSRTLAESILEAVRAAQNDASSRGRQLMASVLGDNGNDLLDLSEFQERLRATEEAFTRSLGEHADALRRLRTDGI
ncbi:YbaB/EbfC family nucleoid-associated protein [Nonomuraea jabiensis]|uniref:YbaB/EbfC family nucleoid-associated protein n=1 Tax=Nonomuraea jabiensis TaxID=882448 RepID=UPI003D70C567